ncbi:extracellular catalytic domain type 1 short-chain-length polyhydroxyalkanoate depolymerase [Amaricoccus solimangrovi]|uniref:PHB depolymerase family esterase n=1 Tax=Amaricoccus solimangrovi TaxID=2589815 RepID=A0A501WJK0_9RHOB|nr:PHB depolymerase family esterase [Amaricoccus solimangrovi]TPE48952.1 PHB depolymerase family esterase [Amaricoccus solimangrovi]
MNSDFARAMSRATEAVRASDPAGATAIIQAALAGRFGEPASAARPASGARREPAFRIAPDVVEAEVVEPAAPPRSRSGPGRRGLREVVRSLRTGRALFEGLGTRLPGGPAPLPEVPEGARYLWREHACAAGTRRYRLFTPSCPASDLRGLVVMLHGCKQNPDDFATGTGMNALAETERLLVAYPEQPGAANVSGCWNWFEPGHQGREAGEPAILASLARALATEFGLPPGRTFAAGLSAGGAMAAVLAETHPDVFAAVGVHSGLPRGSARDVASAFAAMRGQGGATAGPRAGAARAIVFHGGADRVVHPANAEALAARWHDGAGERVERGATGGRGWRRVRSGGADTPRFECWLVDGAGHAWSGGNAAGSFTDPEGPSASAEMLRFFLAVPPDPDAA